MSEIEGDAYEGKKRKRHDADDDDKADEPKEKPAKKKSKKKATPEDCESTPGKYVLLRPQEDEEENPEAASIHNVRIHLIFQSIADCILLGLEPNWCAIGRDTQGARRDELQQSNRNPASVASSISLRKM